MSIGDRIEFIIHPLKGIEIPNKGMIRFGMKPDEIRKIISRAPREFKFPYYEMSSDSFDSYAFHCHYRLVTGCHDIEIFRDSKGVRPIFAGKDIFKLTYLNAKSWFQSLDPDMSIDELGFASRHLGICICKSEEDEDDMSPSEVGIGYVAVFDQQSQTYSSLFTHVEA
jgi:hypothetical protein